ncbi:hypothetical protein QYE76_057554 [Lolium multiflorum]|uniref:Uncharacterized protein n=1 Tax=Lolium multiflorum TaxID=4521 RepID=A0AAD8T4N3_LOLMU|nr:hypothetical protein QYE76_057554 [Lolium multiflorum]
MFGPPTTITGDSTIRPHPDSAPPTPDSATTSAGDMENPLLPHSHDPHKVESIPVFSSSFHYIRVIKVQDGEILKEASHELIAPRDHGVPLLQPTTGREHASFPGLGKAGDGAQGMETPRESRKEQGGPAAAATVGAAAAQSSGMITFSGNSRPDAASTSWMRAEKQPVVDDRTEDERAPIIVDLGKARGHARARLVAVGVFLSVISITSKQLVSYMKNVWMLRGTVESLQLADTQFVLDFLVEGDFKHVTRGGPLRYQGGDTVLIRELKEGEDPNMVRDTSPTSNVDPNNVPLASLVAQEENVDVNFIKNNNFNNNAYRNNSGNNYRPYPSANGKGYGNSYGNSYNNNRSVPSGLEAMLKEFISTQTAFNKSVEEKLDKIDTIASRVDRHASDVNLLKLKVMPNNDIDNKITTTANAIQVIINENIRLMAELRARWDREENEKLAKENNVAKVWTITTTSNANSSHVAAPPTINGKIIGVGNISTPSAKRTKLPEIAKTAETACDKTAEIFSNLGNNDPIVVAHNDLEFDDCHISEVIKFLQKLAKSPNASAINLAFTKHITNALIKAREEKLKLETSIPRKLEDGWEPIIKMKFNDFECSALAPESLVLRRITFRDHQPSTCFLAPTGSIKPWFHTEGNLLLYASYLPLGVPNGRVHLRVSVRFDSMPIWVQFTRIPFYLLSKQLARDLEKKLGECIHIDNDARGDICEKIIRVRVRLPIARALQRWITLQDKFSNEEVVVTVL